MSRNHLIVEGLQSAFRVRDVGSSNGTYVNDSRITVVELCVGDRIKAGASVFEVGFAQEQQRESSVPLNSEPEAEVEDIEFMAPVRTLSSEDMDGQVTKRWFSDRAEPSTDDSDSPPATLDAIGSAFPSQQAPKPDSLYVSKPFSDRVKPTSNAPERDSIAGPLAGPVNWWEEFEPTQPNWLWVSKAGRNTGESSRILDLLVTTEWDARLSLIVNRHQLSDEQCGALDFAISCGEAIALTETLFLLQPTKKEVVVDFFKRCLTKDAAICVASDQSLQEPWLRQAIDALSYPSMLYELTKESKTRAHELAKAVRFLVFEANHQGELCLLPCQDDGKPAAA